LCRDDDRSLRVRADGGRVLFCGGNSAGIFATEAHLVNMFSKKQQHPVP
jgi:hypothetical protein